MERYDEKRLFTKAKLTKKNPIKDTKTHSVSTFLPLDFRI